MVKLTTIIVANNAFIKAQPLTAVFVGATNGIGKFTVRELCKTHGHDGPGLRIIIVGRNEKAAQTILDECKTICSAAELHFVQAGDISLLQSVDKACAEIKDILESTKSHGIDILIQSQGRVEFGGRIGKFLLSLCSPLLPTDGSKTRKKASTNQCPCSTTHACESSQIYSQTCFLHHCLLAQKSSPFMQAAWRRKAACSPTTYR